MRKKEEREKKRKRERKKERRRGLDILKNYRVTIKIGNTHLKLRGQNIDHFMGSISFNPYRGQINHDLGHFL